jgi:RNA polymerase sigma factor (sigma-70 family)
MAMLPVQAPSEQGPIEQIRPRLTGSGRRGLAGCSDESLVAVAKEGDERAFEILYERHSPAILRYCRSLLRSTQEAEDVKQEAFVLAISALRRGAEPDAFRPWLYRVAHNACMSHLRVRRPVLVADNGVLVGPAGAAEPVDGHREELRQLLDDIGKLPDVQRGALLLREMDGFSYEQVGEVLGLPLSTVRASIFRARRTLQGLAEARDADCEEIQSELSRLADRRGRRGRHITTHLNVCATCRDFRDGLRRRPAVLGGVQPAAPVGSGGLLLALKGKLLGGAAAGGAGAALATGGGGAGVAKFAAVAASSIALLAGAGVEADRVIDHSRREAAAAKRHVATPGTARHGTARTVTAAGGGAGATAGAVTAAGSDVALREGRLAVTPPSRATRTTAGARAHVPAGAPAGTSIATRGYGSPRATGPVDAAPSASGSTPATETDRAHASSPRSGERDANRGTERHHGSTRSDDEDSPRTGGGSDSASGSKGSGRERSAEPAEDGAPRQGSSGSGSATPPGTPDDTDTPAPPQSSGPSAPPPPPPTPTAPAPAPAPSGGGTTAPAPVPTPTPAPTPPADPAPPADPPADPGPTGTTSIPPPTDPGTAAVVPAP